MIKKIKILSNIFIKDYFQNLYRKNHMPQRILERSCNFILLEELFKKYVKTQQ